MGNPDRYQNIQDAEVIQNVLLALAQAVDLDQALEIILVNLRNVLDYDRAGLFLLDENLRFILERETKSGEKQYTSARGSDDPIIAQLENEKRPLVFPDVQEDKRFINWKEMGSIRSWIGAPLLISGRLIGFLSIGSLKSGIYHVKDAKMIQTFTNQIAALLERVWMHEQYDRRTEELEVISAFSIALGQADGTEIILSAIFNQISKLFGPQECSILFPNEKENVLTINFSMDSSLIGMSHTEDADILWEVFLTGQSEVLHDPDQSINSSSSPTIRSLCAGKQTIIAVPLKSAGITSGVLFSGFSQKRIFSRTDTSLFSSIAEIAGNALERVLILEKLENKIQTRTNHLSALYEINAFASEQLELEGILKKTLQQIINTLDCAAGVIYLNNASTSEMELVSQYNMPALISPSVKSISFDEYPWKHNTIENKPLIFRSANDLDSFSGLIVKFNLPDAQQLIMAPIKTKMETHGFLLGFSNSTVEYNPEQMTLLDTVAGQLGIFVDRARLISKAEHTAVLEERGRLARELHDSVTQLIYSQLLFAGAGKRVLNQEDIQLAEQYLNRIENQAQQALKEMRLLVFELGPTDHLEQGIRIALTNRLEAVEKRSGIETQLFIDKNLDLDDRIELELYRIAQEALNNTIKHSNSKSVVLSLHKKGEIITLEIKDDGCGFDNSNRGYNGGLGIRSMSERAKVIGGILSIDSQPGRGTRVRITVGG